MKNFTFAHSLIFVLALFLCISTLVSCDRQSFPLGRVEKPKTSPEYDVGVDINKSPAVTPIS